MTPSPPPHAIRTGRGRRAPRPGGGLPFASVLWVAALVIVAATAGTGVFLSGLFDEVRSAAAALERGAAEREQALRRQIRELADLAARLDDLKHAGLPERTLPMLVAAGSEESGPRADAATGETASAEGSAADGAPTEDAALLRTATLPPGLLSALSRPALSEPAGPEDRSEPLRARVHELATSTAEPEGSAVPASPPSAALSAAVERGPQVALAAAGGLTLLCLILVAGLRRHVLVPLRAAAEALRDPHRAVRPAPLPGSAVKEVAALAAAVERTADALLESREYAGALRAGEERLRTILSGSPFPIVITRQADGAVLFFNRHAETLFETGGLSLTLTRDARFFDEPADADRLLALVEEQGSASEVELRMRTAGDRPFWALVSAVEIRDGEEPALLVAINDITQRKRSEEETLAARRRAESALADLHQAQETLIQAEKMASLGALVAGVAHEVNTPVGTALTGVTHLADATVKMARLFEQNELRRADLSDFVETARESCRLIEANLGRAADLIQSFKQTAVDQTSEERRRFELNGYLHDVLTSLHPRLKPAGHLVEVDCPPDLLIDGYPGALAQVLTNLVVNAVTHAFPDGRSGRISLSVQRPGEREVEIRFADDGCGIPEAHRPRIFDPFFTTRRGAGGTGLGLHIVYNLVTTRLGGSIRVESPPGGGTAFLIRFPAEAPADSRQARAV